jgi:hypothetical protein
VVIGTLFADSPGDIYLLDSKVLDRINHTKIAAIVNNAIELLNCLVDFHDIWLGGNAIQVDLDVVIFIPIYSTILKWMRLKVVSWRYDFQPCTAMVLDCLLLGYFGYITHNL